MWEKTISCTSISPDAAFAGVRKLSHIQKAIHMYLLSLIVLIILFPFLSFHSFLFKQI